MISRDDAVAPSDIDKIRLAGDTAQDVGSGTRLAWLQVANSVAEAQRNSRKHAGAREVSQRKKGKRSLDMWLSSKNWYYLLLGTDAPTLLVAFVAIYVFCTLIVSLLHLPFAGYITVGSGSTLSAFERAWWFSLSNIVTSSFFSGPEQWNSAIICSGYIQQMLGILLNVTLFAVIAAKFQASHAMITWSTVAIFSQRDGIRCLQFRIGNRRENLIVHPEVKVLLMRKHETEEGESFMQYHGRYRLCVCVGGGGVATSFPRAHAHRN